jgi:hypothetical protein
MYRTSLEHAPLAGDEAAPAASEADTWRTVAGWAWLSYLATFTALAAWALLN